MTLAFIGLAISSLVIGIETQVIRHSGSTRLVAATLDRDTDVISGRGTRYTDHLSYTIAGQRESDVEVGVPGPRSAGEIREVLVNPDQPRTALDPSNRGIGDLVFGSVGTGLLVLFAGAGLRRVRHNRRARRLPAF